MRQSGWSFHNPVQVRSGRLDALDGFVVPGARVLVVTSPGFVRRGLIEALIAALPGRHLEVWDRVKANPDLEDLDAALAHWAVRKPECVVAIGGGSVIDSAKALSLGLAMDGPVQFTALFRDATRTSWTRRLPLMVVPTTSGTGAEVTPFATLWDHRHGRKHSLTDSLVWPDLALLVPELTATLGRDQTLYPALDAVSHALESLWNRHSNPLTRGMAMAALSSTVQVLPDLLGSAPALTSRATMQAASLMAGLAISQTRTAIAHSISYPLTARLGVPHGLACSFTLPTILQVNLPQLATSAHEEAVLESVLRLLRDLELPRELARFSAQDDVLALCDEMFTADRAGNYAGADLGALRSLVERSV